MVLGVEQHEVNGEADAQPEPYAAEDFAKEEHERGPLLPRALRVGQGHREQDHADAIVERRLPVGDRLEPFGALGSPCGDTCARIANTLSTSVKEAS